MKMEHNKKGWTQLSIKWGRVLYSYIGTTAGQMRLGCMTSRGLSRQAKRESRWSVWFMSFFGLFGSFGFCVSLVFRSDNPMNETN